MAEISNSTLAVLVVTALVVVVAGLLIDLNGGLTGFATSDTGVVNLTINSTLAIQVAPAYNNITFGSCTPRPGASYWCSSNDTAVCSGNNALGNCSLDTTSAQYIRVDNVGNVNASVNVTSECTAAQLIGGTSPLFTYATDNCNGTAATSWTTLDGTTRSACTNVAFQGGMMRFYVNITIPNDAVGGSGSCSDNQATLTFSAIAG